ncbi:hypothetical protein [Halomonas sp. BDJS001]
MYGSCRHGRVGTRLARYAVNTLAQRDMDAELIDNIPWAVAQD